MSSTPSSTSSLRRRLAGFAAASLVVILAGYNAAHGQGVPPPAPTVPAPAATTPAATPAQPAATDSAADANNGNFGGNRRGNRGRRGGGGFAAPTDGTNAPFTAAGAAVPAPTPTGVPAPTTPFGTRGPTPFPVGPAGPNQPGVITSVAIPAGTTTTAGTAPATTAGAVQPGAFQQGGFQQGGFQGGGRGQRGGGGQFGQLQQAGTLAQGTMPNPDDLLDTNFVNASAQDIIAFLQRNTDKVILQAQDLPPLRINFSSRTGDPQAYSLMTRAQVVSAAIALLAMNNVTLVPESDKVWRAYNTATSAINTRLPEIITADMVRTQPSADVVYGEFIKLNYITVDEAVPRLQNFMSQTSGSTIVGFAKEGTIFLADTLTNLKRLEEILKRIDQPVTTQKEIIFKPLKNARAADVLTSLQSLATGALSEWLGTGGGNANAPAPTYLAADARSNSIIVVTNKANRALVDQLINTFDVDVDPATRSEVFVMKQADAPTLGPILQNLINSVRGAATGAAAAGGGAAGGRGAGGAGGAGGGGGGRGAGAFAAVPGLAAAADTASQQQFSQFLTVTTDSRTNSIVVYGTPSDLRQVSQLIDDLDFVLPQVQIEVVVTEVTLTKNQVSGLSTFGLNYGYTPSNGTTTATIGGDRTFATNTQTLVGASAPAFSLGGSLKSWDLNAVFNVARTNSNIRVLSSPTVTTTHNTPATILVGQIVPTINSTTAQINNGLATGNNVTSTVTQTNITIQLAVTPRIGKDNSVQMQITQSVNNIIDRVEINGIQQPVIGTRSVNATVTLSDGGIMVLGGLRSRNVIRTHGVVFLLGEIPIIGKLFQPDGSQDEERELIVFIRPTIVRSISAEDMIVKQTNADSDAARMTVKYLRDGTLSDIDPEPKEPPSANTSQQNSVSTGFRR